MELNDQKFQLIFKIVLAHIFTGLLIYWAWAAFERYYDQPVSSYTTYTQGDDNFNVIFPFLTFCCPILEDKLGYLNVCRRNATSTTSAITTCLANGAQFDLDGYLTSLQPEITRIVRKRPNHLNEHFTINITEENVISFMDAYFSIDFYGVCTTLDTPKLNLTTDSFNRLVFNYANASLDQRCQVQLHTENDYPDAQRFHARFSATNASSYIHLKKKIISRESTRKSPCGKHTRNTCYDIARNQIIADKFKCKVAFLYNGKHLDNFVNGYTNLPFCNKSQMMAAKDIIFMSMSRNPKFDHCATAVPCQRVKFEHERHLGNDTLMKMEFLYTDIEVEHHYTYISYDFQSLIGELGGILGMFMGFSGLSLGFTFVDFIARLLQRFH